MPRHMPQIERQSDPGLEGDQDRRPTLRIVRTELPEAEAQRSKTEIIRKKVAAADVAALAEAQAELDRTKWEGNPNATQPMMPAVESQLTELDRALAEAKGMEQRLQEAGIDPDALAAGKVGLWKRLTHSQLIHDWTEANKAVAELGPKGGVDRRAEQSAGRRARIVPPKAPRSPLGLG